MTDTPKSGSIFTQTGLMAKRNASEKRFRFYGLVAVVASLMMRAFILFTIFSAGLSSFRQTTVTFSLELTEAKLDPKGGRDPAKLAKVTTVGYNKLIGTGFAAAIKEHGIEIEGLTDKDAAGFLSDEAAAQLRARVLADPALIGQTVEINALVMGRIDGFMKGRVTAESAANDSNISAEQLALAKALDELHQVTPEAACAHPNWVMGRKISVDSATMMNKGLEVIEAHWLFAAPPEQIQVVVHPQSVIHSAVEYSDGSVLAQMGNPDMRTPIAYALAYPERIASGVESLDLFQVGRLDFYPPDFERFPCLRLAYDVLGQGGTAPAILNAANEVAVAAFLDCDLPFLGIPRLIQTVLDILPAGPEGSLADVLAADTEARQIARQLISDQRFA